VSQLSDQMGFPITAVHVPKTVDNDLPITDNCPGFARGEVHRRLHREASFDVRSMARLDQGLRHRGDGPARRWIARRAPRSDAQTEIPILILFPEVTLRQEKFLVKAKEKVEKFGYVTVVVSEGCKWPDGKFSPRQARATRSPRPARRCGAGRRPDGQGRLGYKYHWASPTTCSAPRAPRLEDRRRPGLCDGQGAVELAVQGRNSVMPTIVRTSNNPYAWTVGSASLSDVANVEKMMPMEFITEDGFGITPAAASTSVR